MIKLGIRNNLKYPLMLIIINVIKDYELKYIKEHCKYEEGSSSILLMFLSELIAGYIFYKKERSILIEKEIKTSSSLVGIKLIQSSEELESKPLDNTLKIIFLMFAATFFDFYDTFLFSFYLSNLYDDFSSSLLDRLECILAIVTSILCYYLLKFPLYKHQKYSLVVISIGLILIIISEYLVLFFFIDEFKKNKMLYDFITGLVFVIIDNFFFSMIFIVEKYLFEYDYINPFQMLMFEGAFGSVMGFIYLFINKPFKEFKDVYDNKDKSKFIILILGLIIYHILIGAGNCYRVKINKLFSPTHLAFLYYISGPLTIITSFLNEGDFTINGERNYYYFSFNLIISLIMLFCGCVYNELFVLFCCNLEQDTYHQISLRAQIEHMSFDLNECNLDDSF